jgi:hypothetical protein
MKLLTVYFSPFSCHSVLCANTSASSGIGNGVPITKHAGMEGELMYISVKP